MGSDSSDQEKKVASESDITSLSWDMIMYILKLLPMKSIVQCQCVCKDWKNLIKTQSFIADQVLHSAHENPFLLIHAYDYNYQRSTLRLLNHKMELAEVLNTSLINSFRHGWTIIGSSNGLLCVELDTDRGRFPISLKYLLWNPVINEVKEVPQILNDYSLNSRVGFGYSSVVNDYKIVRFYHPELLKKVTKYIGSDRPYCVQVYSVSTGSWKELEIGNFGNLRHAKIMPQAASANETIFWRGFGLFFEVLISFDIATEVFTITPVDTLSGNVDAAGFYLCPHRLFEYGNKLAMCEPVKCFANGSKTYNMFMWVIEEGASESGKSYSCTERHKFGPILYGLQPLCIWRNEIVCRYEVRLYERRREAKVEGDEKNHLYLFNLTTKECRKIPNFAGAYDRFRCSIFNYVKSLVSI